MQTPLFGGNYNDGDGDGDDNAKELQLTTGDDHAMMQGLMMCRDNNSEREEEGTRYHDQNPTSSSNHINPINSNNDHDETEELNKYMYSTLDCFQACGGFICCKVSHCIVPIIGITLGLLSFWIMKSMWYTWFRSSTGTASSSWTTSTLRMELIYYAFMCMSSFLFIKFGIRMIRVSIQHLFQTVFQPQPQRGEYSSSSSIPPSFFTIFTIFMIEIAYSISSLLIFLPCIYTTIYNHNMTYLISFPISFTIAIYTCNRFIIPHGKCVQWIFDIHEFDNDAQQRHYLKRLDILNYYQELMDDDIPTIHTSTSNTNTSSSITITCPIPCCRKIIRHMIQILGILLGIISLGASTMTMELIKDSIQHEENGYIQDEVHFILMSCTCALLSILCLKFGLRIIKGTLRSFKSSSVSSSSSCSMTLIILGSELIYALIVVFIWTILYLLVIMLSFVNVRVPVVDYILFPIMVGGAIWCSNQLCPSGGVFESFYYHLKILVKNKFHKKDRGHSGDIGGGRFENQEECLYVDLSQDDNND